MFLKNFAILTGKHLSWSLSLVKLKTFSSVTLLKKSSNTGVFLWTLQNFKEHIFYRIPPDDCFCIQDHHIVKSREINFACFYGQILGFFESFSEERKNSDMDSTKIKATTVSCSTK